MLALLARSQFSGSPHFTNDSENVSFVTSVILQPLLVWVKLGFISIEKVSEAFLWCNLQ